MPIYSYQCATCGPFTGNRPMAASADPCHCPACNVPAPRVMLQAPRLGGKGEPSAAIKRLAASFGRPTSDPVHQLGCTCCSPSFSAASPKSGEADDGKERGR